MDSVHVARQMRIIGAAIALLGLITAVIFAFASPPFSAPDEDEYFRAIRIVATEHRLPHAIESDAAGHPPLYLFLGALIYKSSLLSSMAAKILALRIVGAIFFSLLVFIVFQIVRNIDPKYPASAMIAALIVALWPQLAYISASVSSDGLLILLTALTVLISISLSYRLKRISGWMLMAAVFALGIATKQRYLFVIIPVVLIILHEVILRAATHPITTRFKMLLFAPSAIGGLMLAPTLVIGVAEARQVIGIDGMSSSARFASLIDWEWQRRMFQQAWGCFGGLQIPLADGQYLLYLVIMIVAAIGIMKIGREIRMEARLVAFAAIGLISSLLLMTAMAAYETGAGAQGRYLFTLIAFPASILGIGISRIISGKLRMFFLSTITITLLLSDLYGVFYRVLPFYY